MNQRCAVLLAAVSAVVLAGCATKKYVQEQVAPIQKQTAELDKRSAENASAIQTLEQKNQRDIARVEERIGAVDTRAGDAARRAREAGSQATQAGERAEAARTLAQSGIARAERVEKTVENLENYRVNSETKVYFDFGKATLNDEAKQQLDALAGSLGGLRRFVLEVQGFTDTTGDADYNYTLSERRADAVVRYLTTRHKVPVYRIHTLALGKDNPVEAENRREGRRLSRRVEIKLYVPVTP